MQKLNKPQLHTFKGGGYIGREVVVINEEKLLPPDVAFELDKPYSPRTYADDKTDIVVRNEEKLLPSEVTFDMDKPFFPRTYADDKTEYEILMPTGLDPRICFDCD